ncbi:hypothetical protein L596_018377 [Steinernema carpocapsae]|uniref:Uncharacterized protein n=1 Tax=Steinernema carpocapsae TaxID=34508 RepID=A0A4U5N4X6_STECR|nr:hypothetical protein L596_018377 [Steinernema carpocapsae]
MNTRTPTWVLRGRTWRVKPLGGLRRSAGRLRKRDHPPRPGSLVAVWSRGPRRVFVVYLLFGQLLSRLGRATVGLFSTPPPPLPDGTTHALTDLLTFDFPLLLPTRKFSS